MEEVEFWNSPKRMRIRPKKASSKLITAPMAGDSCLRCCYSLYLFVTKLFLSPGEAARLLGLVRLILGFVEPPSHTGPANLVVPFL